MNKSNSMIVEMLDNSINELDSLILESENGIEIKMLCDIKLRKQKLKSVLTKQVYKTVV